MVKRSEILKHLYGNLNVTKFINNHKFKCLNELETYALLKTPVILDNFCHKSNKLF